VQNFQHYNKMNGNFRQNYKIMTFSCFFFEEVFRFNKLKLLNYYKNV